MTDTQPPQKVSDSLVGQAVTALPDEILHASVAEFQTFLAGLRDIPAATAKKIIHGEALLRADAADPAASLYTAADRTVELYGEIRQLESQFDTSAEGTA